MRQNRSLRESRGYFMLVMLGIIVSLLSAGYIYIAYNQFSRVQLQEKVIVQEIHLAREQLQRFILQSGSWMHLASNWESNDLFTHLNFVAGYSSLGDDYTLRVQLKSALRASRISQRIAKSYVDQSVLVISLSPNSEVGDEYIKREGLVSILNANLSLSGFKIEKLDKLKTQSALADSVNSLVIDSNNAIIDSINMRYLTNKHLLSNKISAMDVVANEASINELEGQVLNATFGNFEMLSADVLKGGGDFKIDRVNFNEALVREVEGLSISSVDVDSTSTFANNLSAKNVSSRIMYAPVADLAYFFFDQATVSEIHTNYAEIVSGRFSQILIENAQFNEVDTLEVFSGDMITADSFVLRGLAEERLNQVGTQLNVLTDALYRCVEVTKLCIPQELDGVLTFSTCDGCKQQSFMFEFVATIHFNISNCSTTCFINLEFSEYFSAFECTPFTFIGSSFVSCTIRYDMTSASYFYHQAKFELIEVATNTVLDFEFVELEWEVI